jgi:hypothetical protein
MPALIESSKVWVFVLVSKPDLDNIFPLIKKTLERGQPSIVLLVGFAINDEDFRLKIICSCANLTIVRITEKKSKNKIFNKLLQLIWTRKRVKCLIKSLNCSMILFEWGDGVIRENDSIYRKYFSDIISHMKYVALELKVPTVALPHGHSTKMGIIKNKHTKLLLDLNNGLLPFSNRNSFSAYVFCAEFHREAIVSNSTMSGENAFAWGSLRYNDVWVEYLYGITPEFSLPKKEGSQIYRVLFFLPKWQNLIDRNLTMKLIIQLSKLPTIQLIVKCHVRKSYAFLTKTENELIKRQGTVILLEGDEDSTSLIKSSDVLIDVDSSIAFDAILLKKPYIRPRYLQDSSVRTIYDQWGGAHQVDSARSLIGMLSVPGLEPEPVSTDFEANVFGGRGKEIFETYFNNLKAIEDEGQKMKVIT